MVSSKAYNLDTILNIAYIENIYHKVKLNTKHRNKIFKFELFYSSNIIDIYNLLKYKKYKHSNYNIFLIKDPKYRIIMSENIIDKIVNHLLSEYIILPLIDPTLIKENIATRKDMGLKMGEYYMKSYINKLKKYNKNIYVLKCDIHKYFYNIDHNILIKKLKKLINDEDIMNLIKDIISSTYDNDTNDIIDNLIEIELSKNLSKNKINELKKIPHYNKGVGLPIGNMTSQLFAIFYLNDLDHFIKEKLHIKYYIRYMDDFVLFSHNKEYLNYCLEEIRKFLSKEKLRLNDKTKIINLKNGINFLGYRYILKDNRLIVLVNNNTKKKITNKLNRLEKSTPDNYKSVLASYNGYFKRADTNSFLYRHKWYLNL